MRQGNVAEASKAACKAGSAAKLPNLLRANRGSREAVASITGSIELNIIAHGLLNTVRSVAMATARTTVIASAVSVARLAVTRQPAPKLVLTRTLSAWDKPLMTMNTKPAV